MSKRKKTCFRNSERVSTLTTTSRHQSTHNLGRTSCQNSRASYRKQHHRTRLFHCRAHTLHRKFLDIWSPSGCSRVSECVPRIHTASRHLLLISTASIDVDATSRANFNADTSRIAHTVAKFALDHRAPPQYVDSGQTTNTRPPATSRHPTGAPK